MDVSIIIVNYNTLLLTKNCIDSIFNITREVQFEVILIDNASTDNSKEYFERDWRIRYFYLSENLGFGKANNFGIKKSTGKYIFCLNSDTILINNAVKIFFDYYEDKLNKNVSLGAVGCMLENLQSEVIHSYGSFPSIRKILSARILSPIYTLFGRQYSKWKHNQFSSEELQVDYVTGADLFVQKELLDKYGGFDPDFFMYFEETELQYRLFNAGFPSFIINKPRIVHLEGASINNKPSINNDKRLTKKLINTQKSEFLYINKTHNIFQYILYRILFFIIRIPFLVTLKGMERNIYFKLLIKK